MRRALLWITSWLCCSVSIYAHDTKLPELGIEFRTDLELKRYDSKTDINRAQPRMLLSMKRIHINAKGQINEHNDYRIRVRWNESLEARSDNTGAAVEYWYLRYHVDPRRRIDVGKQILLQGGLEGSYNPIDAYSYSLIGAYVQKAYEVGASYYYDMSQGDQQNVWVAQVLNEIGGGHSNQELLNYNFAWYTNKVAGVFEVVVQYGILPKNARRERVPETGKSRGVEDSKDTLETLLSLGALLPLQNYEIEFDLLTHTEQFQNVSTSSLVFLLKQRGLQTKPFVKLIMDSVNRKSDIASGDLKKMTRLLTGVEYLPKLEWRDYKFYSTFEYLEATHKREYVTGIQINVGLTARF